MRNKSLLSFLTFIWLFTIVFCDHVRIPFTKKSHVSRSQRTFLVSTDNMTVYNYQNVQYIGSIFIGSDNQKFSLQLDTGSAWLWVPAQDCSGCSTNYLQCSAETLCQQTSNIVTLQYGMGDGNGYLTYAPVSLGENFTVSSQALLQIFQAEDFDGLQGDGILGLGFAGLSDGIPTVIDNLYASGAIPAKRFSFFLGNDPNSWGNGDGELIIGGYDPAYFDQSQPYFINLPVNNGTSYWALDLNQFALGSHNFTISNQLAVIDSGTSLFTLPTSSFYALLRALQSYDSTCSYTISTSMLTCGCDSSNIDQYPTLYFTLVNQTLSLESTYYLTYSDGTCMGMIAPLDVGLWILGDTFMRKYYTLFDEGNMTIGFAPAAATAIPSNHWWMGPLIILVIVLVVVFLFFLYQNYRAKQKKTLIQNTVMANYQSYVPPNQFNIKSSQ